MAKIGEGSSPRSVLGSWEMDARGEFMAPGKTNCAKNKGFSENKGLFGNKGFSEKMGLFGNKGFSEKMGLFENNRFSGKKGFSENEGFSEDKGLFENKGFFESKCLYEEKGFWEKMGFSGNKGFSEIKGLSVNKGFSINKGFCENEGFSKNEGFSENKGLFENKVFFENKVLFDNNDLYGNKGFSENKNISDNKDFSGSEGFSGNEGFSRNEGFSVNKGFSGNKGFSESGFEFWATEDEHEVERIGCRRNMGVLREKCVKEDRIRVSANECFSENKGSGLEFGATENEHDVKRNGCRRKMGVSREKCVKEERLRVSRLFAPSLGECEGGLRVKRRRKKEKEKEEENYSDPLVVLGSDIMLMILYRLDARSLAQSILVSHGWQSLAACDHLWSKKCEELWFGKAHLPRAAMQRGLSKLAAYSISVLDAKRTRIMKEDLCNHVWEFRFKTTAPLYWLNLDPSWRGTGPPMRRYFHPDGSQTADLTDRVWGGHECTYSIVTSTDQGKEYYVRINRWPRMSVSRKHDWGWELDNHVYYYSSISDSDKEGGTGPLYPI